MAVVVGLLIGLLVGLTIGLLIRLTISLLIGLLIRLTVSLLIGLLIVSTIVSHCFHSFFVCITTALILWLIPVAIMYAKIDFFSEKVGIFLGGRDIIETEVRKR